MNEQLLRYIEKLNVRQLKDCLLAGVKEFVHSLESQNHRSQAYAIALDCNVLDGQVEISYSLEESLPKPGEITLEKLEPGDWNHHTVTEEYAPNFYKAWAEFSSRIERIGYDELYEELDDEKLSDQFFAEVRTIIRDVLMQANSDGVFKSPSIAASCYIFSIDHDQELLDALAEHQYEVVGLYS